MKNLNFIVLTITFLFSLSAQAQVNQDSLWGIWNDINQADTIRLEAIQKMQEDKNGHPKKINPDSSLLYAQLQYDLAKENNLEKWMVQALLSKGRAYTQKGDLENAIKFFNESKSIAKRNNYLELLGKSALNLGSIYLKQSSYENAFEELTAGIAIYEPLDDKRALAYGYDHLSMYFFRQQNAEQSLNYLNKSLAIKEELIKNNENDQDRYVINSMKQTIAMINNRFGSEDSTGTKEAEQKEDVLKEEIQMEDTNKEEKQKNEANEQSKYEKPDAFIDYTTKQIEIARESGDLNKLAEALTHAADNAQEAENYERAITNYLQALEIYRDLENKFKTAETLEDLGLSYFTQSKYHESIKYSLKAIELYDELGTQNSKANLLNCIGISYKYLGNINLAIDYLNKSKELCLKTDNQYVLSSDNNLLATIYSEQKDYPKALELFNENLDYFKKTGDKINIAGIQANIANVYNAQNQNEEALEKYLIALNTFEETGYKLGIADVSGQISSVYLKAAKYKEALEYANLSITTSAQIQNKIKLAYAQKNISDIYRAQGKYKESIAEGKKALAIAQEFGHLGLTRNAAKNLADSYKALGQYKPALEFTELYFESRDSLNSTENQKAFIRQQFQADYEKQKALDDLENEKLLSIETQKKENQQKLSIAIGTGLFVISLFALGLFSRLKLTRKQKAIIEEQKQKVEQSEKYKEQFLANMSHEIRTPMHAISGMLKIIKRNPHPQTQEPYLKAMEVSTENLIVILNDVLDMSKIEAGKLDIENISINPASIIQDVQQILKFKAEEKALDLKINVANDVPAFVIGDPTRLNQILLNLAGNAIKFTEKGLVEIALEKKNEKLVYSVRDTGIGISQEGIERIFAPFVQAQTNTAKFYGGTGLGLSITKQLVELQNGKIWAESELGKGSTFFVEFPLILASEELENQSHISKENLKMMANSLKGIRILLAEDNPFNQMIARDDLEYYFEDVQLDIVENGVEAIKKYKENTYDIILMDVQMPLMNGFETTTSIRKIEETEQKEKAIRIVAMTASLLKTEIDKCYHAGMNDYIPKPYQPSELVGTIYKSLKA